MEIDRKQHKIFKLAEAIAASGFKVTLNVLEIGAAPHEGADSHVSLLQDAFPGSCLSSIELDEEVCAQLNQQAKPGNRFYSAPLGKAEETRLLFETVHPMCTSLYPPNEPLLKQYNLLEVSMLKQVSSVHTTTLDSFTRQNSLNPIDLIKIDTQGAELDIFSSGKNTLKDVLLICTEVEFIPLYKGQPLFGDVCNFLADNGLMFHKFLGLAGRTLAPFVLNNNPAFATQHMWSDALFMTDISRFDDFDSEKLLKLGCLMFLYGSPDVSYRCFSILDARSGSSLAKLVLNIINS